MPPKRVMRPRSSSSESSGDDSDAPMEVSMSAAKSTVLKQQQVETEALDKLAAVRREKASERAAEIKIVQEKKRRRLVRLDKKKAKIAAQEGTGNQDDESNSEDDQQLVQLAQAPTAVTITDDGDFIFNAEDLLEASAVQNERKQQRETFSMNATKSLTQTTQDALSQKLDQQKRIAEMLKAENAVSTRSSELNDKSKKHGKFQVISSKGVTSHRAVGVGANKRAPSARDLLAMAHGFTAGTQQKYAALKLQHVPRQHSDTNHRFAKGGVSNSILDRGHSTKQKLNKERSSARRK